MKLISVNILSDKNKINSALRYGFFSKIKVVKKKEALPFKVPKNITLVLVDVESGLQPNASTKKIIYESFKTQDNILVGLKNLSDKDRLGFYDSGNKKTILEFY